MIAKPIRHGNKGLRTRVGFWAYFSSLLLLCGKNDALRLTCLRDSPQAEIFVQNVVFACLASWSELGEAIGVSLSLVALSYVIWTTIAGKSYCVLWYDYRAKLSVSGVEDAMAKKSNDLLKNCIVMTSSVQRLWCLAAEQA
jgi:hypothetical protein